MTKSADFVVDRRDRLDAGQFAESYVGRGCPVLIKNALEGCAALSRWSLDYLREKAGDKLVQLKVLDESGVHTLQKSFGDYARELDHYEKLRGAEDSCSGQTPAYLHDVPLTTVLPRPEEDLEAFPADFFPEWYRGKWWRFAQMFLGPCRSLTPLHFDCLLTHNLFFQIRGRKRFVLIGVDKLASCYPHDWRWSAVDVENPDYDRFPLYRTANPVEVVVEPGDALYLPPGTLHHVRSLDCALSFNVDWHTRDSALKGVLAASRGMPLKNVYYNAVIALGLWGGVPAKQLLPFYSSYLNYVS